MMPAATSFTLPADKHGQMALVVESDGGGFSWECREIGDQAYRGAVGPVGRVEKLGVHEFAIFSNTSA